MPIIRFKSSTTASAIPASLQQGEFAVNVTDARAYVGNASGVATKIIGTLASQNNNAVSITGGTVTVASYASSAATPSTLTLSGTNLTSIATTGGGGTAAALTSSGTATYSSGQLSGRLKNIFTYASAGTFTYTKSGTDVKTLHVMCVGGGGGARAYSECGGGGGYTERVVDATSVTSVTVTVGGGGGGGAYFGFSGNGATSSFGAFCSATGGFGSSVNAQHNGGHGGLGYGGSVNTYGGMGGSHNNMDQYSGSNASGGIGGGTYFGGCLQGDRPDWSTSSSTGAPGTGGVAVSPSHNGQGGRSGLAGIVIVYEYR
jgi:hypothetical protein